MSLHALSGWLAAALMRIKAKYARPRSKKGPPV